MVRSLYINFERTNDKLHYRTGSTKGGNISNTSLRNYLDYGMEKMGCALTGTCKAEMVDR